MPALLLLDAIEIVDTAQEDSAVGDGRRRPGHLLDRVLTQLLKLRAGLDDVGAAFIVEAVDFVADGHWRCPESASATDAFLRIGRLAGPGVEAVDHAAVALENVNVTLVDQRRGHAQTRT